MFSQDTGGPIKICIDSVKKGTKNNLIIYYYTLPNDSYKYSFIFHINSYHNSNLYYDDNSVEILSFDKDLVLNKMKEENLR